MKDSIFLTPSEEHALRSLAKGKSINQQYASTLCERGFAESVFKPMQNEMFVYQVTAEGLRYIAQRNDSLQDRRWTRGLAIVAILVSLLALVLEFDDRGYLDRLIPEKTNAVQPMPKIAKSQ